MARKHKVKVLFIGDELQLPPVHEFKSLSLTEPKLIVELTEIIRQKGTNPLIDVLSTLRDDILNGTDKYLNLLKRDVSVLNDKGEGYTVINDLEHFKSALFGAFTSDQFKEDKLSCKYEAWTNGSVMKWNKMIREQLFQTDAMIAKGDMLMAYTTVLEKDTQLLTNSEEYKVLGLRFATNTLGINGYDVHLQPLGSEESVVLFVVSPDSYNDFLPIHKKYLDKAIKYKGGAWREYYAFKRKNLLLTDIKAPNGALIVKKDLDYGYGLTIHKTQGSTYGTSFVNGKDLNKNKDDTERRKLWYVALSRASKQCVILL